MSTTTVTLQQGPEEITAHNVLRLFPDVQQSLSATHDTSTSHDDLAGYDEEQIKLMDEVCIVLDREDHPIGSASKKTCHLMSNINAGLLHRAFSVFLFDPDSKKLLLQQRASEKITFPDMWTNTCCSHPLGVPSETGSTLDTAVMGVKRAAQRKLDQELGISKAQVPINDFKFLTRIHYLAPSDGKWGEHESKSTTTEGTIADIDIVDYILFIQAKVDLKINPNEVQAAKYVSPDELKELFKQKDGLWTPWFRLICESFLFKWWQDLDNDPEQHKNEKIERL